MSRRAAACLLGILGARLAAAPREFSIPAEPAGQALLEFSRQAGAEVLFSYGELQRAESAAVRGALEPGAALDRLLAPTGFAACRSSAGKYVVVRAAPEPKRGSARAPASSGDVVRLPSFDVSNTQERGYRATNSVSATRIEAAIQDLPFAVSAFTLPFIEDTGARALYDVVRYAPGVGSAGREFNTGDAVYTIRGFAQGAQHDGFFESSQANVYVDTADVERVEVVKGPASLLYGQVLPGGTVNYITKRAEAEPFSELTVRAGSHRYARTAVDVNQPASEDLLLRVNVAAENGFQYARPSRQQTLLLAPTATWRVLPRLSLKVSGQWLSRREDPPAVFLPNVDLAAPSAVVAALNGAAGYPAPSAALSNKVGPDIAAGFQDASDPGFLGYFPLDRRFNYDSVHDYRKVDTATLDAEAEAQLGERWVARLDYDRNDNRDDQLQTGVGNVFIAPPGSTVFTPGSGWSVAPAWNALSPAQQTAAELAFAQRVLADPSAALESAPAILPRRQRFQEVWGGSDTLQAEVAGAYRIAGGEWKPLAGLYYDHTRAFNRVRQDTGTPASPFFPSWDVAPASPTFFEDHGTSFGPSDLTQLSAHTLAETSDQAAYAALNAQVLGGRLKLIAGARYNVSRSQVTNYLAAPGTQKAQGYRAESTTPQVGAGYDVAPGLMLYASYAGSYTLPAQSFLRQIRTVGGTAQSVPVTAAKPTTGEGYEAGAKAALLGGRVSATVSAYQIEQEDVVSTFNVIVGGITLGTDVQGTRVRSRGLECELTWTPLDNWELYASAAEDDVRNVREPDGFVYYLGAHPEATTKTLASAWSRYDLPGALRGLWIAGGLNYSGPTAQRQNNPDLFLPAYWLWNSAAGCDWTWRRAKLSALLNWENMGNALYYPANQQRGLPERVVLSLRVRI